ncbi:MAG: hypothetical protein HY962_16010 [Ignavibacteriae bacterium]|nr:hypothetical protein [Ignavibacteriota bacterium]
MNIPFVSLCALLVAVVIPSGLGVQAQGRISMTLNVAARPSPYVSDWSSRREYASISVITGPGTRAQQARFKGELYADDKLLARTKQNEMPVITLPSGPGSQVYFAESMFPHRAIEFIGGIDANVVKTGMLPAGTYRLCLELVSVDGRTQLAENAPVCAQFVLTDYESPILLIPENNAQVNPAERPTFRWTPVTPQPPGVVRYTVSFFERIEGQSLSQVLKQKPLYEKDVVGMTQLPWPPEFTLPARVKQVVWTVRGFDDKRAPLGARQGYAEPFAFMWSETQGTATTRIAGNCGSGAYVLATPADNTPKLTNGTATPAAEFVGQKLTIGDFSMFVKTDATGASNGLSGSGIIVVPWLKAPFAMKFSGIKINTLNQVYEGSVKAEMYGLAVLPPLVTTMFGITESNTVPTPPQSQQWQVGMLRDMHDWLKEPTGGVGDQLALLMTTFDAEDLESCNTHVRHLPFGLDTEAGCTIAICALEFTPTGATAAAAIYFPLADFTDQGLGCRATNIPIDRNGPSTASGTLGLIGDIEFSKGISNALSDDPNENTFTFAFKGAGTSISWDCMGFANLHVEMDILFPRAWLIPIDQTQTRARMTASFDVEDWDNWMVDGLSLSRAAIVNSGGLELEIQNATIDHSTTANTTVFDWSQFVPGSVPITPQFTGFTLAEARLYLPDALRKYDAPEEELSINVSNVVISETLGFTGEIVIGNILPLDKGHVGGFAGSIDEGVVQFLNGSLSSAAISGKIVLPVSDVPSSSDDPTGIAYLATWDSQTGNATAVLTPSGQISARLFHGATMALDETSNLAFSLSMPVALSMNIDATVGYGFSIGSQNRCQLDMSAQVQSMQLVVTPDGSVTFNPGVWTAVAGGLDWFPFSHAEDPISYSPPESQAPTPGALAEGDILIPMKLALDALSITADLTLKLGLLLNQESFGPLRRMVPGFRDITIPQIEISLNTAAVSAQLTLSHFEGEGMWGRGFSAFAGVTFRPLDNLQLEATVMFGTTSHALSGGESNALPYRYWYVAASAVHPPGYPFMSGLGIYGVGAGAWRHLKMQACPEPAYPTPFPPPDIGVQDPITLGAVPDPNTDFGFFAKATIGTWTGISSSESPQDRPFNADVCIEGHFNDGSLSYLSLDGQFWAGLEIARRVTQPDDAPVRGFVDADAEFAGGQLKKLTMDVSLAVNIAAASGTLSLHTGVPPAQLSFEINRYNNPATWFFKLGRPQNPNTLYLGSGTAASIWQYLEFGNAIDVVDAFQPHTVTGLIMAQRDPQTMIMNMPTPLPSVSTGQGMLLGVGLSFNCISEAKQIVGNTYVQGILSGGFEANASMLKYAANPCGTGPFGWHDWYCRARFAVWLNATIGTLDGADDNTIDPDFMIACAAWAKGGFPNPSWVKGKLLGKIKIGPIEYSFELPWKWGHPCEPPGPPGSGGTGSLDDEAFEGPQSTLGQVGELIGGSSPANNMQNVSTNCGIAVEFPWQLGEPFTITGLNPRTMSENITMRYRCVLQSATLERYTGNQMPGCMSIQPGNPPTYTVTHGAVDQYGMTSFLYTPAPLAQGTCYMFTVTVALQQEVPFGSEHWAQVNLPDGTPWREIRTIRFKTSGPRGRELDLNPVRDLQLTPRQP